MPSYTYLLLWLFLLVKKGTGDESQFYVSSNRFGCDKVDSVQPCPATHLNPDLAFDYETDADMVNITLDEVKMNNASQECISALKTTYCSSLTPRCFVNGSRDYGDARTECWKASRTCPFETVENGFCESLRVGRHPASPCVKPSKPINGSCPQPKLKMPEDKLELYVMSSIEYEDIGYFDNLTKARFPNGTRMFSNYCAAKIMELYCLPFYCSEDEKHIIVEYTLASCEDIVNECFDTAIIELFEGPLKEATHELRDRYIDNCVFYPDYPDLEDPTSMGSGNLNENLTTPAYQNVSSTPSRKNVSTTPRQGTPSATSQAKIASTIHRENTTSTTHQQKTPPTTSTSTTSGQNTSSKSPKTATAEPKDTKIFTFSRKTKPSLPVLVMTDSLTPTTTPSAGNDRCQTVSYSWLSLFFFLALLI